MYEVRVIYVPFSYVNSPDMQHAILTTRQLGPKLLGGGGGGFDFKHWGECVVCF